MSVLGVCLSVLLVASRPVAVPGPVCASPDNLTVGGPADDLRVGEEAYFLPECRPEAISSDLLFAFNSAVLKPTAAPVIASWASRMAADHAAWIITGHTDWIGSDGYNQRLSMRRAEAVREALIRRGISPQRLTARGRGESQPVADNRTDAGRSLNRRVEVMRATAPGR